MDEPHKLYIVDITTTLYQRVNYLNYYFNTIQEACLFIIQITTYDQHNGNKALYRVSWCQWTDEGKIIHSREFGMADANGIRLTMDEFDPDKYEATETRRRTN
jgi:hypothetical protein